MEKQGSPSEIITRSSPGAQKRPSLLEILSGKVQENAAKAKEKVVLEEAAGENVSKEEIKNGSRDR